MYVAFVANHCWYRWCESSWHKDGETLSHRSEPYIRFHVEEADVVWFQFRWLNSEGPQMAKRALPWDFARDVDLYSTQAADTLTDMFDVLCWRHIPTHAHAALLTAFTSAKEIQFHFFSPGVDALLWASRMQDCAPVFPKTQLITFYTVDSSVLLFRGLVAHALHSALPIRLHLPTDPHHLREVKTHANVFVYVGLQKIVQYRQWERPHLTKPAPFPIPLQKPIYLPARLIDDDYYQAFVAQSQQQPCWAKWLRSDCCWFLQLSEVSESMEVWLFQEGKLTRRLASVPTNCQHGWYDEKKQALVGRGCPTILFAFQPSSSNFRKKSSLTVIQPHNI